MAAFPVNKREKRAAALQRSLPQETLSFC